jgi:hypothetical protein
MILLYQQAVAPECSYLLQHRLHLIRGLKSSAKIPCVQVDSRERRGTWAPFAVELSLRELVSRDVVSSEFV